MNRFLVALPLLVWPTTLLAAEPTPAAEVVPAHVSASEKKWEFGIGLEYQMRKVSSTNVHVGALFGEVAPRAPFGIRLYGSANVDMSPGSSNAASQLYYKSGVLAFVEACPLGVRTTLSAPIQFGLSACGISNVGLFDE